MRRHDFHMFVERDRSAGWRDRSEGYRVVMQLRGREKRVLVDATDQLTARSELARLVADAGRLLLEDLARRLPRF